MHGLRMGEAQSVNLDGFHGDGPDIYVLTYRVLDFGGLSPTLGLRYDWRIEQRNGYFRPAVPLVWAQAFDHAGRETVRYAEWLTSPPKGVAVDSSYGRHA